MKKKLKLQQQILISFFLSVITLVVIQFFFTWYLFSFNIKQTENLEISKSYNEIRSHIDNFYLNFSKELEKISQDTTFINAITGEKNTYISKILKGNKYLKNTIIYNSNDKIIYGNYWSLIDKYSDKIFSFDKNITDNYFFSENSGKAYIILRSTIRDKQNMPIGIAVSTFQLENILPQINKINIDIYTSSTIKSFTQNSDNFFKTKIDGIVAKNLNFSILRKNQELAFGISVLNDINQTPQAYLIIKYYRVTNNFFRNGILFFALIILAFSLLIASFLGLWFGKSIMQPVKEISNHLSLISKNPSNIKPFTSEFKGVLGDITDVFSQMNLSLIESRKSLLQYKSITDHINVGIFFMDEDNNIIVCNPAFHKIFQTDLSQKLNLSKLTQISSDKLHEIGNYSTHNYYLSVEIDSNKKYLILDLNLNKEGDTIKYFGSITDETTMVKTRKTKQTLELELIKSNRLAKIGKLLVGVVHNLNSPLNSIVGYSQFLKEDFPDNKDIHRLHQSAIKISSMVKGLLNKNRNENRSMPQNINVNEVINDELEMCEHNIFFKHYVVVNKNLSDDIKFTNAVYSDISLCIANILNNAIDAMQNSIDKELTIKSFMQDDYIVIQISDSGCGIAEENFDKIFDINYSSKLDNNNGGYGIGLALTKAIIEKSNGKIEVSSIINKGTTFTLYFPKM
jgi:signal transduction histidine kinase